jgi:hypothetical protein
VGNHYQGQRAGPGQLRATDHPGERTAPPRRRHRPRQRFNADESHLIDITELVVFGSYLDPDIQHLGDLDLSVAFHSRIPDRAGTDGRTKILLSYARASGRSFNTFLDQLFWPEHEALLMLRNRSAAINITLENVRTLTDRWQVVYSCDG